MRRIAGLKELIFPLSCNPHLHGAVDAAASESCLEVSIAHTAFATCVALAKPLANILVRERLRPPALQGSLHVSERDDAVAVDIVALEGSTKSAVAVVVMAVMAVMVVVFVIVVVGGRIVAEQSSASGLLLSGDRWPLAAPGDFAAASTAAGGVRAFRSVDPTIREPRGVFGPFLRALVQPAGRNHLRRGRRRRQGREGLVLR
eukprot:scaffold388_cov244-Pinguiococcus_pyrenoidosus.AAC.20